MTLLIPKIIAALAIFLLALVAGLLPIRLANTHKHLLSIGDAFAGGVFLSAALLHMLPNAQAGFHVSLPTSTYPWAALLIVITFIFLFLLEHGALLFSKKHFANSAITTPYLLAALLMIHALLEGAAIGVNTDLASLAVIFFAVLAHKGSASFALSINLHRYKVTFVRIAVIILLFSLMTPIGIYITAAITDLLQNGTGQMMSAIFNSLAAGTFLYLGTVHVIAEPDRIICKCGILALLAGVIVMAVVAVWV